MFYLAFSSTGRMKNEGTKRRRYGSQSAKRRKTGESNVRYTRNSTARVSGTRIIHVFACPAIFWYRFIHPHYALTIFVFIGRMFFPCIILSWLR